ncbi:PREDICTED: ankyrin-1-like isoform X2 [Nelumbo nucifera]|uniref:Ankyrin-1-like isoform X2 n=2 Tax=Nelumbo nucifera TaxID=4432 RepID=A0A1U8BLH3_NELNU|nr:PREDICTED: ankyrin-1-like isoform X2 [Nelumbo nucifera]DAD19755.1 TPA_asm: hypothetical protein HUJ06_021218 [Nelumbo nucifera]
MASHSEQCGVDRLLFAAYCGELHLFKKVAVKLDWGEGLAKTVADIKDSNGQGALHHAAAGGRTQVCKCLLKELKLDVDVKDGRGATPFFHAILGGHIATANYLLKNGADPATPNVVLHHIFTPLMLAILAQSFECTKLLLKEGAGPNIGSFGITPLGIAASEGETEMIKCLLKGGADPNIPNFYGLKPIEVSALNGNYEDVMILFPKTSPIQAISHWSPAGIIRHMHSEEARQKRNLQLKEKFMELKAKGEDAFKRKEYLMAIRWYTEAMNADPLGATLLSNRSLCWARLKEGERALSDATACIMLRPDWPKAYYREGAAWMLLKEFGRAADAFSNGLDLDPENRELQKAFSDAVEASINSLEI